LEANSRGCRLGLSFDDYRSRDATALAELVATGQVTTDELIDAAVDRHQAVNPVINAVVSTRFEAARAEAARVAAASARGPFAGVPFLIKDLTSEVGEPVTFGSVFFKDFRGVFTPEVVHRFRRAGLVSVGRTNAPELGLLPVTEPVLHGATRNPWSLDHTPGGSSGGAAAAVAAGIVPMAHASDGGGSIRIPASACGLFGMKPTRGRVPLAPAGAADYLSTSFCISRSVRDSAILLDAIAGASSGDRFTPAPPRALYRHHAEVDPPALRIAFTTVDLEGNPIHRDCIAAVEQTVALLEGLGHHVEQARPSFEGTAVRTAFLDWWKAMPHAAFLEILAVVEQRPMGKALRRALGDMRAMRAVGKVVTRGSKLDAFEPFTWELVERGLQLTAGELLMATTVLQTAAYALGDFLVAHDVLLTATLGEPPKRVGELDQRTPFDEFEDQLSRYVPYTPVANFSGFPAMTVPLHRNAAGLPIGSHFLARGGDEATLFQLAGQLERAQPWFDTIPEVPVGA
jgi:amidase